MNLIESLAVTENLQESYKISEYLKESPQSEWSWIKATNDLNS